MTEDAGEPCGCFSQQTAAEPQVSETDEEVDRRVGVFPTERPIERGPEVVVFRLKLVGQPIVG